MVRAPDPSDTARRRLEALSPAAPASRSGARGRWTPQQRVSATAAALPDGWRSAEGSAGRALGDIRASRAGDASRGVGASREGVRRADELRTPTSPVPRVAAHASGRSIVAPEPVRPRWPELRVVDGRDVRSSRSAGRGATAGGRLHLDEASDVRAAASPAAGEEPPRAAGTPAAGSEPTRADAEAPGDAWPPDEPHGDDRDEGDRHADELYQHDRALSDARDLVPGAGSRRPALAPSEDERDVQGAHDVVRRLTAPSAGPGDERGRALHGARDLQRRPASGRAGIPREEDEGTGPCTEDVVPAVASERLARARDEYAARYGSPLERDDEGAAGPPARRWAVPTRLGLVAALAVALVAGVVVARAAGVLLPPAGQAVDLPEVTGAPGAAGGGRSAEAGEPAGTGPRSPADAATALATPTAQVVVHVVGQVARPGIVELPAGARVTDALTAAGGPSSSADLGSLNLARLLVDGEQVVVLAVGEAPPVAPPGPVADAPAGGAPLDLNAADVTALDGLPGIGPVLAGRIVAWREEHGPFRSVEQLADVEGIGPALLERLASTVRV